jgi:hypothetical protein
MSENYKIVTSNLSINDVVAQLRAIKHYPCMVNIYDRAVRIDSYDECDMMIHGIELGSFLTEERFEQGKSK